MVQRAHWGSRLAFILASAGSAIGLGNLWKFPYEAGMNGGGYFVLIYISCVLLVGIPIMIAELYIGQQAQTDAVDAFARLHKRGTWWRLPGWLGLLSAFFILSFYSVVGGWILDFEFRAIFNEFSHLNDEQVKKLLGNLLSAPLRQTVWHLLFMLLTMGIVIKGISEGLERWSKILMPALFMMLLGLLIHSFFLPGFSEAFNFMFSTHGSQLSTSGVVSAVGQAFFSLSLGMGVMITYGSYLNKDSNLLKLSFMVAFLDTLMALLAGLVIFAIVFSFNLEPAAGPGLIFSTLPTLFRQLSGGYILSIVFFLLVTFAALTSAVSILEVAVAYLNDHFKLPRIPATLWLGGICALLGLLAVFSHNILSDVHLFGLTFFDFFDKMTSSYFLPIGGMLISLFFGWVLGEKATLSITKNHLASQGLLWITRVFAPLSILIVFVKDILK